MEGRLSNWRRCEVCGRYLNGNIAYHDHVRTEHPEAAEVLRAKAKVAFWLECLVNADHALRQWYDLNAALGMKLPAEARVLLQDQVDRTRRIYAWKGEGTTDDEVTERLQGERERVEGELSLAAQELDAALAAWNGVTDGSATAGS